MTGSLSPELRTRFWSKVEKTDGCWLWTDAPNQGTGYGRLNIGQGRTRLAHRIAYELLVGPVPVGLTIDHLCRNRLCVNPAHLEPVTRGENVLRGVSKAGRSARPTHCPRGHAYDDANTYRTPVGGRQCRACKRLRDAKRPTTRAGRDALGRSFERVREMVG